MKAAVAEPEVYVQYQGNESNLAVITERIKKQYVEEGHFAPGSMLPKVQAALDFAESKPGRQSLITLLEKAKPVIEKLPGWKCDIRGIKKYEDLPENCRKYVEFVEKHIGFPITMISNGPGRNDIIYR